MIQAIYFALCFAAIFLGCIISIHVDFGEISRMKKVVQVRQTEQKERNKK